MGPGPVPSWDLGTGGGTARLAEGCGMGARGTHRAEGAKGWAGRG